RVIEVCGPGTIEQSIKATRLSGEISLVGTLAGETSLNSTDLLRALLSNVITLRSVSAGSRAQFVAMNRAVAQHRLKPVIDRTFSFEETHAAFRYYEDGQYFGKIIISSL
ncbi:MAG TPA: zinc-binding dehydrogenase, partial [Ktedonobacteraceae bacterium]|nr:zinc-binding dehydrogenase [Ktedonobacteraceae bacterium]